MRSHIRPKSRSRAVGGLRERRSSWDGITWAFMPWARRSWSTESPFWRGLFERRGGFAPRSEFPSHLFGAEAEGPVGTRTGKTIDIGRRSPAFPVTPPYVRVRIRRFGGLSDWPPGETSLNWSPLAGLSTGRFAASDSTLPRQSLGLHPYPLSGRPGLTGYSAACRS